ncbi:MULTISPECIES: TIGR03943 family putative permease subunit [Nocardiopsis]|uniref:TIGR03943 family protein n=1 Tax=Nocardiopsis sinuspersici TaxID=501010 RepID=A0A1V3C0T0_9ACTN|nr:MULTISPECIES: TIGR03943 family protein [Nocardiopsis]OOC54411.1 TIGR03943 family protein [Nocardiopsis sinuspersici]
MNRIAQGLTLVLLGAAALTSTVATDLYLNWVKPSFGPFLIAAGVVMAVLGVLVIAAELRGERKEAVTGGGAEGAEGAGQADPGAHHGHADGHGHDHSRAPGVAWLLLLPVLAVFVVAPPALGSYTVESTAGSSGPPPEQPRSGRFDDELAEAVAGEVVEMDIRQFVMRAWVDEEREMAGREIELTGFAVPASEGEGWYLARLQMSCCAADAIVNKVRVLGEPAPETDTWWTVRGTWVEPEGEISEVSEHEFEALEMEEVTDPPDPYE